MIDKLLQRVLKNNCPICNKLINKEFVLVNYGEAKLKVCKKHVKYKENKHEKKNSQIK